MMNVLMNFTNSINNLNTISIFHHPAWFSVLSKTYGFNIKIFGPTQSSAQVQPLSFEDGIPFVVKKNKYVSLPFSDYVSLLNTKEETDLIITNLLRNNSKVEIEIRDKYEGNGFERKLVGYKHILRYYSRN